MTRFIIIMFLSSPFHWAYAQPAGDPEDALLFWNEFYKLQWHDFKGEPGKEARGDAGAVVLIKAKPFMVKKEIKYDVVALFNRSKSWARDQAPSLLAHEQLHFDIAELYARKIRRKIRELQNKGVNDVKTYNAAIEQLLIESNEVDLQYDIETLHGALSKKQAAWSSEVSKGLSSLNRYKKAKRIIGRSR